jgi:hypothetical protein
MNHSGIIPGGALALLLFCTGAWAQSLQILPSPPTHRESSSFQIMIVSPAGNEPVALQWKLAVPEGVTIKPGDLEAGSAAKSAGKSITCAVPGTGVSGVLACILIGGQTSIPDGAVTVVRFHMQSGHSSAVIRLHDILAVLQNLKSVKIAPVEGIIRVN